jgi:hypothetical protein
MNTSTNKPDSPNDTANPAAILSPESTPVRTALDSILGRGQHADAAAVILAIAGRAGGVRGSNIPSIGLKHRFRPLPPIQERELAVLPPRAWLLRKPDATTADVFCSESLGDELKEALSAHGLELGIGHFYKFVGSAEVAVFHFSANGAELDDEQFAARIEAAEAKIDQKAKSPQDLEYRQKRRRYERECLAIDEIYSVARLIDTHNTDDSVLGGNSRAGAKSAGLGPQILWKLLPSDDDKRPPDKLTENSTTVLLQEDACYSGRRIYLWKSRKHRLWICNRVRNQEPFYSTLSEANFSRPVSEVGEIDGFLTYHFGYSLTDVGLDPVQIYAWVMSGDQAFEKECRQRLRRILKAAGAG